MDNEVTTGKALQLLRIAKDVQAKDLADRMGIKPSGVSAIEARRVVTAKARARYVAALATFATPETAANGQDAA